MIIVPLLILSFSFRLSGSSCDFPCEGKVRRDEGVKESDVEKCYFAFIRREAELERFNPKELDVDGNFYAFIRRVADWIHLLPK